MIIIAIMVIILISISFQYSEISNNSDDYCGEQPNIVIGIPAENGGAFPLQWKIDNDNFVAKYN